MSSQGRIPPLSTSTRTELLLDLQLLLVGCFLRRPRTRTLGDDLWRAQGLLARRERANALDAERLRAFFDLTGAIVVPPLRVL